MKKRFLTAILLGSLLLSNAQNTKIQKIDIMELTQEWDKIFPKSNKVDHTKVMFKNRYGITLVGDLYVPKNIEGKKLSAIATSGPFEQLKNKHQEFMLKN